jgi:hypothetical protein
MVDIRFHPCGVFMLLAMLDIDRLERVEVPLNWGQGDVDSERFFYRDDRFIYKLWSGLYTVKDLIIDGGQYIQHPYANKFSGIAAIDLGFVNRRTCSAFVDTIWSDETYSVCIGYVTKIGVPLVDAGQISEEFFNEICQCSLDTGYFHSDFKPENIIELNGHLSLIDFDTVLSRGSSLQLEFEEINGSLRQHVFQPYRDFIIRNLEGGLK